MARIVKNIVETLMFPGAEAAHEASDRHFYYLPVQRLGIIAPFWFMPAPHGSHLMVLYAHGNGTDLGSVRREMEIIAKHAKVHVCAFEYPGYGKCEASPTVPAEQSVDLVAEAVLDFLVRKLSWPLRNIVFWGTSIGSGVLTRLCMKVSTGVIRYGLNIDNRACQEFNTCLCASWEAPHRQLQEAIGAIGASSHRILHCFGKIPTDPAILQFNYDNLQDICECRSNHGCRFMNSVVGGLILQAPLASIRKTASQMIGNMVSRVVVSGDTYDNERLLPSCRTCLMIIHGKKDEMFHFQGSLDMLNQYTGGPKMGVFPDNADHNCFNFRPDILEPFKHFLEWYIVPRAHRIQLPCYSEMSKILYVQPHFTEGPPIPLDVLAKFRPEVYKCCYLKYVNGAAPSVALAGQPGPNVPDVASRDTVEQVPRNAKSPFTRLRRRLRGREPLLPAEEYTLRTVAEQQVVEKPFLWPDNVEELRLVSYTSPVQLAEEEVAYEPYPLMAHVPAEGLHRYFEVAGEHQKEFRHEFALAYPRTGNNITDGDADETKSEESPVDPLNGTVHALKPMAYSNWIKCPEAWIYRYNRILVESTNGGSEEDEEIIHNLGYFKDTMALSPDLDRFVFQTECQLRAFLGSHKNVSLIFIHCKKRFLNELITYMNLRRNGCLEALTNSGTVSSHPITPKTVLVARTGKSAYIGNVITSLMRHMVLTAAIPSLYLIFRRRTTLDPMPDVLPKPEPYDISGFTLHGLLINGFFITQHDALSERPDKLKLTAAYMSNGNLVCNQNAEIDDSSLTVYTLYDIFPFPEFLLLPVHHQRYEARLRSALASDIIQLLLEFELRQGHETLNEFLLGQGLWRLGMMIAVDYAVSEVPTHFPSLSLEGEGTMMSNVATDLYEFISRLNLMLTPYHWLLGYISFPSDNLSVMELISRVTTKEMPVIPAPLMIFHDHLSEHHKQCKATLLFRWQRDSRMSTFSYRCSTEEDLFQLLKTIAPREVNLFGSCVQPFLGPEAAPLSQRETEALWYAYHRLVKWHYVGTDRQVVSRPETCKIHYSKSGDYIWKAASNVPVFEGGLTSIDDVFINSEPHELENLSFIRTEREPAVLLSALLKALASAEAAESYFTVQRQMRRFDSASQINNRGFVSQMIEVERQERDLIEMKESLLTANITRRIPALKEKPLQEGEADEYLQSLWFPATPVGQAFLFDRCRWCLDDLPTQLFDVIRDTDFKTNHHFMSYFSYTYHCALKLWRNVVKLRVLDFYATFAESEELKTLLEGSECKYESIYRYGAFFCHQWLSIAHCSPVHSPRTTDIWTAPVESNPAIKKDKDQIATPHELTALQDCFTAFVLALGAAAPTFQNSRVERAQGYTET